MIEVMGLVYVLYHLSPQNSVSSVPLDIRTLDICPRVCILRTLDQRYEKRFPQCQNMFMHFPWVQVERSTRLGPLGQTRYAGCLSFRHSCPKK